jgi:hypothetical protein
LKQIHQSEPFNLEEIDFGSSKPHQKPLEKEMKSKRGELAMRAREGQGEASY